MLKPLDCRAAQSNNSFGATAYVRRRSGVLAAETLAREQHCVVSRRQLATIGVTRYDIAREVRRGRWRLLGRQTVAIHRGPLVAQAWWRRALWEVGCHARIDGSTALSAAGMEGYDDGIHLGVPHGSTPVRVSGVVVHELRSWSESDTVGRSGLRSTRTALATLHAAMWPGTERQAALVIVMAVQQRLTTGAALMGTIADFKRLRRRALITGVVHDAADGVQSLGELDVARECRRRGLPEPSRQAVRRGYRGRAYLDVFYDDFGLVVEIEGAHHDQPLNAVDDSLRQNELSIEEATVLRIPVLGWRTDVDAFMNQVERALRARGWTRPECLWLGVREVIGHVLPARTDGAAEVRRCGWEFAR